MKQFLLLFTLCAFFAASWADVAHAVAEGSACVHHETEMLDVEQDCDEATNQDQIDVEPCQDCHCCHTHVVTKAIPHTFAAFEYKTAVTLELSQVLYSRTPSPLYRPPIA